MVIGIAGDFIRPHTLVGFETDVKQGF